MVCISSHCRILLRLPPNPDPSSPPPVISTLCLFPQTSGMSSEIPLYGCEVSIFSKTTQLSQFSTLKNDLLIENKFVINDSKRQIFLIQGSIYLRPIHLGMIQCLDFLRGTEDTPRRHTTTDITFVMRGS